jgi:ABC-2 type transport system permease protein
MSVALLVIMTVACLFKKEDLLAGFAQMELESYVGSILCAVFTVVFCLLNGMMIFTAPSVSLEGKTYWLIRSLPVSSADILRAKLKMHLWITVPVNAVCALVLAVAFRPSFPVAVLSVVIPVLYSVWVANIGLICGLCHPVLDWINEAQVVKQGTAILLTMLFAFLPVLPLAGIGVVLAIFSGWLSVIAVGALILLGDVLTYRYLMRGGVRRWENLG